jgi:hypothetical protein
LQISISGYYVRSEDSKEFEVVISGKMFVPVSKSEYKNKIYKLLEENCDLFFCTVEKIDDFPFYPVPMLAIFAFDSKGKYFGTIGGIGDIVSDDYPVGYINQEGMRGKISGSLKEFLELVTFYPYWRDIIKYEKSGVAYDIDDIKMKEAKDNSQYFAYQNEISETLNLLKNLKSIELLISNIRSTPGFVVYSSINDDKVTNAFLEYNALGD